MSSGLLLLVSVVFGESTDVFSRILTKLSLIYSVNLSILLSKSTSDN